MSAIDTPLTRDFPSVAHLSRPELEQLVGPFDPARPSVPWYASPATPGAGAGAGAGPSAPPAEEHAFEALVDSLAEVRALRAAIDALTAQSTEKAARNAALQPALEALRLESQALHDRARQLRDEAWPAAQREMNDVRRRFDPPAMLATLGQSAARLHDRSESFASAFVEGLPLDVVAAGVSCLKCTVFPIPLLTLILPQTARGSGRDSSWIRSRSRVRNRSGGRSSGGDKQRAGGRRRVCAPVPLDADGVPQAQHHGRPVGQGERVVMDRCNCSK